jgi:hypothetical protein
MAGISWKESLSRVYEDSNKYMKIDGSTKEQIDNLTERDLKQLRGLPRGMSLEKVLKGR